MTEAEIIEKLAQVDGVSEVYHVVSTFKFYRKNKAGDVQRVIVQILDAGPKSKEHMQYHCFAKADDGRTATGNPDSSIESALSNVHWEHLDYPVECRQYAGKKGGKK